MPILAAVLLASTVVSVHNKATYPSSCTGLPYKEVVIHGKMHRLYWTIDDHPNHHTEAILKILNREKIKATFFLVTFPIKAYYRSTKWLPLVRLMSSVKKMVSQGHSIGNHSVTHRLLCKLTDKEVRWEVSKSQYLIKRLTGVTPKHWRPPHGLRCRQTYRAARRYKLRTVMWDVSDYRRSSKYMWNKILRRIRRGFLYTIVLVHRDEQKLERLLKRINSSALPVAPRQK